MSLAGDGTWTAVLNPAVLGTVELEELHQLFGGRMFRSVQPAEVLHLQQGGHSFKDLVFVVADGMEVGASGKDGCYHGMFICWVIRETRNWGLKTRNLGCCREAPRFQVCHSAEW